MRSITFGKLFDGSPLDLPLDLLLERHFMVQGSTGQRKTLFVISLLLQFLAMGHAVFFIDLGGDRAAYALFASACRELGKTLRLFSLNPRHDSMYFDPLVTDSGFIDQVIAANVIASGLNLLYSDGYGRGFWGRFNLADLNEAFDHLHAKGIQRPNFAQLISELRSIARSRRRQSAVSEAVLAADMLARIAHFGMAADPHQQLNIANIIESGGVGYFYVPAALYGASARAVATLSAWSVMVEAAQHFESSQPPRVVHVALDEYAQVAAGRSTLEAQLTLCRKWGVQMHLLFQSAEQMRTPDGDLGPILRDNCQRFYFTVASEQEQRELMACSLDEIKTKRSITSASLARSSVQSREELLPTLERNEILKVSGEAMKAFAVFNLGDQHRDPIPFAIIPPTKSIAEHTALKLTRLPEIDPHIASSVKQNTLLGSDRQQRHAALQAIMDKLMNHGSTEQL